MATHKGLLHTPHKPVPKHQPSPRDESMPMGLDQWAPVGPWKPWLTGCAMYLPFPPSTLLKILQLNGQPIRALIDSGSSVTLIQPTTLATKLCPTSVPPITCVHGSPYSRAGCQALGAITDWLAAQLPKSTHQKKTALQGRGETMTSAHSFSLDCPGRGSH